MNVRNWKRGTVISMTCLAILVIVALLMGAFVGDSKGDGVLSTDSTSATTTTIPGGEGGVSDDDLKVRPGDLIPEAARCASDEFVDHSLRAVSYGDPEARWWPDAISIPYDADAVTEELVRSENVLENCGNPTVLEMNLRAYMPLESRPGFVIGEQNPWMGECLTLIDASEGSLAATFLIKKEGEGDELFTNEAHQECAEMMNVILMAFQFGGMTVDEMTIENWHIAGPTAGDLPRAQLNDNQENLASALFFWIEKGQVCPSVKLGYNVYDRRFVKYEPTCDVPPGSTTTLPGETTIPGTTVPGVTTTVCGDKATGPNCTPAYTTVAPTPGSLPTTTRPTTPPTAAQNTLPPGVTPTTHDYVPTSTTYYDPDGPPIPGGPPTSAAPPTPSPSTTAVTPITRPNY